MSGEFTGSSPKKILIFGNSGSGKSTLARQLCEAGGLAHMDLDTVAWNPGLPPERKALAESQRLIEAFTGENPQWVIEGCYADLMELVIARATEIVFMNLPVDACIANARQRPWEPHKYESKAAQDANLDMLVDWIAQYENRDDTFSKQAHENLYKGYTGVKTMYTRNERHT